MVQEMGRYWRIYRTFFASSFARELEFRANFFAKVGQSVIWCGFFVMILLVVYGRTDNVAGWNRSDGMVLAAVCFLMNAVTMALTMSLMEIPTLVRMGTLDFILTKPVDSQFWVSSRKFNFDQIGTMLAGIAMLIVGINPSDGIPAPLDWLGFGILFVCSVLLFYSFNLSLMTLGIWWVRVDNLWVLGESVMQVARYPIDIYSAALQRFFIYAVPLAFVATLPSRQLVKGFDVQIVALGVGWTAVAFVAARLFWRRALKSYASASS